MTECVEVVCEKPGTVCNDGQCVCQPGTQEIHDENGTTECQDIDECERAIVEKVSLCDTQVSTCVNSDGSYYRVAIRVDVGQFGK